MAIGDWREGWDRLYPFATRLDLYEDESVELAIVLDMNRMNMFVFDRVVEGDLQVSKGTKWILRELIRVPGINTLVDDVPHCSPGVHPFLIVDCRTYAEVVLQSGLDDIPGLTMESFFSSASEQKKQQDTISNLTTSPTSTTSTSNRVKILL